MATSGIDSTTTAAILTAMHGGTAVTFAAPIKLLFLSSIRTVDTGTDVEWVAGGSSYVPGTGATVTYSAAAAGAPSTQANATAATITNAPSANWAGCIEVDSSGTPKKLFWAALASPKTVNLGDTVTVPIAGLSDSLG